MVSRCRLNSVTRRPAPRIATVTAARATERPQKARLAALPRRGDRGGRSSAAAASRRWRFAIVSGLLTHGYHLFRYPLYITDEGIYIERAWAVIRGRTG